MHSFNRMALISYIIPCYNEEACIEGTLDSIEIQNPESEIIVVDGGSSDETRSIVKKHRSCRLLASDPGRGKQMNLGAAFASGDFLCFLHADTRLPPLAAESIFEILRKPFRVAGSYRLGFDKQSKLLSFYARCSYFNTTLCTYGDQGLFLRTKTFESLGGFKDYPFLEDVEIQQRLRRQGIFEKSNLSVTTSARRFESRGVLRQQILNTFIVSAFLCGVSPFALKKLYPDNR